MAVLCCSIISGRARCSSKHRCRHESILSAGSELGAGAIAVVLATGASIIASQAVISGVFAITQQCQQLGYIPRVRILHSSATAIGQVYVPAVNWLICAATLGLAVGFGTSSQLAHAYGVGVACTMLIDTVLLIVLMLSAAGGPARLQLVLLCALLVIDLAFVFANLEKVPTGGWFPLCSAFSFSG